MSNKTSKLASSWIKSIFVLSVVICLFGNRPVDREVVFVGVKLQRPLLKSIFLHSNAYYYIFQTTIREGTEAREKYDMEANVYDNNGDLLFPEIPLTPATGARKYKPKQEIFAGLYKLYKAELADFFAMNLSSQALIFRPQAALNENGVIDNSLIAYVIYPKGKPIDVAPSGRNNQGDYYYPTYPGFVYKRDYLYLSPSPPTELK